VPVNRGSIVVVAVLYVHDNLIALACLDGGARVGAVEGDTTDFLLAIRGQLGGWVDGEPVLLFALVNRVFIYKSKLDPPLSQHQ